MMKALSSTMTVFIVFFAVATVYGQSNEGTNFWFGFMQHRDVGQNSKAVIITSKHNTAGTIRIPLQSFQQNFTVAANSVTIIQMPVSTENTASEVIEQKGIQVVSDEPVSVYIHQYHAMRSEATLVLPVSSLGQEYYTVTYKGLEDQNTVYPSEFLLVGVEDTTHIMVTVSDVTKAGKTAGTTFPVTLNPGETYQVQAGKGTGDMTGSYITGDKKFSVLAGASWTQVPSGCDFRDNLLEQMLPVSTWGRQFISAPFAHMAYDLFRIIASENNTVVSVKSPTGTQQYTLNAGQFAEYKQSDPTFISATRPVMVAQFLVGSNCSGYAPNGDPSILVLNSIEQIRDTVTLYNSHFEAIVENYINLVMKTVDVPGTLFDGAPVANAGVVQPVMANPDYSFAQIKVNEGAHTIISLGCGVIASAYGYGNVESYAYGGGASFKPLSAKSLIPEGGCLHDTLFFDTGLKAPRHSFKWDLGDGATSTDGAFTHVYNALGTYHVTLLLTDNCLNMTDTLMRDLKITLRQAAAVSGDTAVCTGAEVRLSAKDLAGAVYTWTGPNQFFSPKQYPLLSKVTAAMAGPYQVVGTVSGCASFPATSTLTVYPLPTPYLGRDTVVCPDDNTPLLILNPGIYSHYIWSDLSTGPVLNVLNGGAYRVQVQDQHGCWGTDSIFIKAQCPSRYYIPNIFSPNDDGVNDQFGVFSDYLIALRLTVYDRWGNRVFEGNTPEARWDGYFHGRPVESGVYTWVARIEGFRKDGSTFVTTESGSVTVVR
jgi:gliding motility-associated-like protein